MMTHQREKFLTLMANLRIVIRGIYYKICNKILKEEPMNKNEDKKISELTVSEFKQLQKQNVKTLVKWAIFFFIGIPILIYGGLALYGLVMIGLADKT